MEYGKIRVLIRIKTKKMRIDKKNNSDKLRSKGMFKKRKMFFQKEKLRVLTKTKNEKFFVFVTSGLR